MNMGNFLMKTLNVIVWFNAISIILNTALVLFGSNPEFKSLFITMTLVQIFLQLVAIYLVKPFFKSYFLGE